MHFCLSATARAACRSGRSLLPVSGVPGCTVSRPLTRPRVLCRPSCADCGGPSGLLAVNAPQYFTRRHAVQFLSLTASPPLLPQLAHTSTAATGTQVAMLTDLMALGASCCAAAVRSFPPVSWSLEWLRLPPPPRVHATRYNTRGSRKLQAVERAAEKPPERATAEQAEAEGPRTRP